MVQTEIAPNILSSQLKNNIKGNDSFPLLHNIIDIGTVPMAYGTALDLYCFSKLSTNETKFEKIKNQDNNTFNILV